MKAFLSDNPPVDWVHPLSNRGLFACNIWCFLGSSLAGLNAIGHMVVIKHLTQFIVNPATSDYG